MIKINLLPIRASKKREAGKQWLVLFGLVLLATVGGNWFWVTNTDAAVSRVRERVNKYNGDLQTLNKIIGEVKDIKNEKAEIEKKLDVLRKLKDGRTGPVRFMDEVSTIIPAHVWVSSWDEKEGNVTLACSATNLDEVANWLLKLQGSKFFDKVQMKSTRQVSEQRVDFTITAQVKYSI